MSGIGSASKRTLVRNGIGACQQIKIWSLDDYCPIPLTEISLKLILNHKKQTYLSVTSVSVTVFQKNFSNQWSDQQDLQKFLDHMHNVTKIWEIFMERHDCLKDNVIDSCCACYILCRWIVILCCHHVMMSCACSILCRWVVRLCCIHIMMSCTTSILCRWIVILCCHRVMMSCTCSILYNWVVGLCCIHIMMSCACSILCRWVVILCCHHVMMSCACSILCLWIVRLCCLYIMMSCAFSISCRWMVVSCCQNNIIILCCHHIMTSCASFILCCWVTMLCWMFGTDLTFGTNDTEYNASC